MQPNVGTYTTINQAKLFHSLRFGI